MSIPMQRCGASPKKPNPETPPAIPNTPASASTADPYPLSAASPKVGTPWENDRYKQILSALQDETVTIINIDTSQEDMPTIQGQLAAIYKIGRQSTGPEAKKRTTFSIPTPKDIDDEENFRAVQFGLPVASPSDIERLTIGNFPVELVKLAWWSLRATNSKVGRKIDLLSPELYPAAEKARELEITDKSPESINTMDAALTRHVCEFLARKTRGVRFDGVSPGSLGMSEEDFAKLALIPINIHRAMDVYKRYLNPGGNDMIEYARKIAENLYQRKITTPAALDEVLGQIRPREQEPRTIPLDYNILQGSKQDETWKAARENFFLEKPSRDEIETIIIDLTSMPSELFFVDSAKGTVLPPAAELLARIKEAGRLSKKKKKVILLSNSPLKSIGLGGKEDDIQGIGNVSIPSPAMEEIKGSLVPVWVVKSFVARRPQNAAKPVEGVQEPEGRYRAIRGGREIALVETKLDPKTGREKLVQGGTKVGCVITPDGQQLAIEMSRYLNGFSLSGIDEYVAKCLRLSGTEGESQVGTQAESIDLDKMLSTMQEHYTETLFKISGGEGGSQLHEVFKVVDTSKWAGKDMRFPTWLKEILRNIKSVNDVESLFESKASQEVESLKAAVKTLGLDPQMDLNIPPSRYLTDENGGYILDENGGKIPSTAVMPGMLVWDELKQEDLAKVREQIKKFLPESQVLGMQVSGPPGMGKTSTAKAIAKALGYMFVEWTICATKNKYVGETGKNVRAMFRFVERLKDTVLLLDEVDKCLGRKENTGVVDPVQGDIVEEFQKRFTDLVNVIAPKNHLFIIATSNYPQNLAPEITRRLKAPHEMDYLKNKDEINDLVDGVFSRWEGNMQMIIMRLPNGEEVAAGANPEIPLLKQKYVEALFREAQPKQAGGKGAPYSNDEIGELLRYWINWNRQTVSQINKKYMKQYKKDFLWDPMTLIYMVQRSRRQSMGAAGDKPAGLIPEYPPENIIIGGGKPMDTGKVAPTYGRDVTPAPMPPSIQTQPTAPPIASEIDVPAARTEAESQMIAPAGRIPRQAAKVTKASVKLLSIADNAEALAQGLKYISHLPEMTGMLFKFQSPRVLNFWMQDTYVPLDIAFIDDSGRIVKTEHMIPMSLRTVSSGSPCVMALETSAGTLDRLDVKAGKKVLVDYDNKTVTFND